MSSWAGLGSAFTKGQRRGLKQWPVGRQSGNKKAETLSGWRSPVSTCSARNGRSAHFVITGRVTRIRITRNPMNMGYPGATAYSGKGGLP
jgi:hypothetical protein